MYHITRAGEQAEQYESADDLAFIGSEPIGAGASAQVWKAREASLNRTVAVRLIMGPDERAILHARTLAKAKHPNVVEVHYVKRVLHPKTNAAELGIVLELVEGPRLDELLRGSPLSKTELRRIADGLFSGVGHLHRIGLAHGDLHEGNILVSPQVVKILDLANEETEISTLSMDNRRTRDLEALWRILQRLLYKAELDQAVIAMRTATAPSVASLESLRAGFETMVNEAMNEAPEKFGHETGRPSIPDNRLRPETLCERIKTKPKMRLV